MEGIITRTAMIVLERSIGDRGVDHGSATGLSKRVKSPGAPPSFALSQIENYVS